ncbi:YhgE/Pip family protein [Streptomyces erythrochromogenes]|uniref:YhgE/Pip family protein n=1 Tax=Streptomyces erythrochromogenes TaxID=285574 RepID=UPI0036ACD543
MEVQRFRGPRLQWVPALLVLLPLLTGTLIWVSLWDPRGNMERVPAAIVNLDSPVHAITEKGSSPLIVEAGNRLVDELKLAHDFSWHTLGEEQAKKELEGGGVYLAVVIPPNFSASMAKGISGATTETYVHLHINDANNYLVGETAKAYGSTIQDYAAAITLSYAAKRNVDTWDAIRRDVDKILNIEAPKPLSDTTSPQPANPFTSAVQQIATHLNETAKIIDHVNGAVQSANSGSSAMAAQINDAASQAQLAQNSAASNNAALVQQSTTQANTSIRLVQTGVTNLAAQLLTATNDSKNILEKVISARESARALSVSMENLEKELESLAKSIPPTKSTAITPRPAIIIKEQNLHPAGPWGRGLAPLFLSLTPCLTTVVAMTVLRPYSQRALASPLNACAITLAGWLPLALVSVLATCGLYGVSQSVMKLDALSGWATLALCILTASACASVGHALKVLLGAGGEILYLVLLAFQFAAAGGLYPIQASNSIFADLHRYVPMAHTIRGFRAAISGGQASAIWTALVLNLIITVVGIALTSFCLAGRRQWTYERLFPVVHERCS